MAHDGICKPSCIFGPQCASPGARPGKFRPFALCRPADQPFTTARGVFIALADKRRKNRKPNQEEHHRLLIDTGQTQPTADSAPLAPGRRIRRLAGGLLSAVAVDDHAAINDRQASRHDRIVGSRAFNRLVWGARPEDCSRFAEEALCSGTGPMLDAGCGTALLTATAYRRASRPLVLVDRSAAMLGRAADRLADAPATLIQADIGDLPFPPGAFETVACFAALHLLDDPWNGLAALGEQVAPGGRLYVSMLVADRDGLSRRYLEAVCRRGELGPPRRGDELEQAAREILRGPVHVQRTGSMAWLRAAVR